jgi:leucyl/phenylalanyl-tRNA--protein transferase
VIPFLRRGEPFPPVELALRDPNGLLAAGDDLSTERLVDAYARGIFPWFGEEDPVLWWSPDPRMVLLPDELHVSRSLRRTIRSGRLRLSMDVAFLDVMEGCAASRPGQSGTWITTEVIEAYAGLADLDLVHSVEAWNDDRLVGGVYGVALGRMFFGESMFSRATDASKVALVALVRQLGRWGFGCIDCQMATPHLAAFGAREIPRADFIEWVNVLVRATPVAGPWRFDDDLLGTMP